MPYKECWEVMNTDTEQLLEVTLFKKVSDICIPNQASSEVSKSCHMLQLAMWPRSYLIVYFTTMIWQFKCKTLRHLHLLNFVQFWVQFKLHAKYKTVRFVGVPFIFYARQHICYSAYMPWQFRLSVCLSVCLSICLSVRPSVTRVDQLKTVKTKITQFHHTVAPSL